MKALANLKILSLNITKVYRQAIKDLGGDARLVRIKPRLNIELKMMHGAAGESLPSKMGKSYTDYLEKGVEWLAIRKDKEMFYYDVDEAWWSRVNSVNTNKIIKNSDVNNSVKQSTAIDEGRLTKIAKDLFDKLSISNQKYMIRIPGLKNVRNVNIRSDYTSKVNVGSYKGEKYISVPFIFDYEGLGNHPSNNNKFNIYFRILDSSKIIISNDKIYGSHYIAKIQSEEDRDYIKRILEKIRG